MERWVPVDWTRNEVARSERPFSSGRFLENEKYVGVVTAQKDLQVRESGSLRVISGAFPLAAEVADFDASVALDRMVVATRDRAVNAYKLDGSFLWGVAEALPGAQGRQVTLIPEKRWVLVTANNFLNKPGGTRVLDLDTGREVGNNLIGEGQHESHAWLAESGEVLTIEKGPLNVDWVRLWDPLRAKQNGQFPVSASRGYARHWPRFGVLQVATFGELTFYAIQQRCPIAFTRGTILEANDLSPDGRLLGAGREDGRLELREVDLAASTVPSEKILTMAVAAFSGSRLDENGTMQIVPLQERAQLLQTVRNELSNESTCPLGELLLWKFQPGSQAPLSPAFNRTRRAEADRLIRSGTKEASDDAWYLDPTHPLVHLALAAHADPQLAEFYRVYDLQRLPEDGMLSLRAAEILLMQGLRDDATRSVKRAVQFAPTGPAANEFQNAMKSIEEKLAATAP
jgi:hypothetical protein